MRILESYLNHIQRPVALKEYVPFTRGKVKIEFGKVSSLNHLFDGIPAIVVNELKLVTLKSSFIFASPTLVETLKNGGSCKGELLYSIGGQKEEFIPKEEGTAYTTTNWFGMPNPKRTLDSFFRAFESFGIRLEDVNGISVISNDKILDFTRESHQKCKIYSSQAEYDKSCTVTRLRVYKR